nr:hypothetical protein [Streptomyces acidiscabies]
MPAAPAEPPDGHTLPHRPPGDVRPQLGDDTGDFVPRGDGEAGRRGGVAERADVGAADAGGLHVDPHLAAPRCPRLTRGRS